MTISRRSFLHAGAVAAVVAVLPLSVFAQGGQARVEQDPAHVPFPVPGESRLEPTFYLNKASFTPYLNSTFKVRGEGKQAAATLTLVAVEDLRASERRPGRDGFSLLFSGARQKPLEQGTYLFTHDALGEFSLLLVRLHTRQKGQARYEAIINRLYP